MYFRNLPLEIVLEITKHLTIFDLENLESSDLFELNENDISDTIVAAFENLPKINIEYKRQGHYDEKAINKLILRCGIGLKMLKVKCRSWAYGFLDKVNRNDKNFIKKLAARCPNIERFRTKDNGIGHYIRRVGYAKLTEVDPTYIQQDILPSLFTSDLKSLTISQIKNFIDTMEALNNSHPHIGLNIQCLRSTVWFKYADVQKIMSFFPNLQTIHVKTKGYDEYSLNRKQFNNPNFMHNLQFKKIDNSSVVKSAPQDYFDPVMFDRLENLQSLRLDGNQMMIAFSDYLTDTTFKSLKRLDFTGLQLDAANLAKFAKIVSTGRFFINSIVGSNSIDVHNVLIPLLGRFCRNIQRVWIELLLAKHKNCDKRTVKLTAEEKELINRVGIRKVSFEIRKRHKWYRAKQHKLNFLTKNV